MEIVSGLSGRWLEIVVAVYLIGMILYGHYRGFIKLSVSALALVITLVSVHFAMPYVTDWLKNSTPVYEKMKQGIMQSSGLDDMFAEFGGETGPAKTEERMIIEGLELPEQLKQLLIENNNNEVYEMMGVELFGDYVGGYLADTFIKIIAFILLFVIVFILLHVAVIWLDLIAKLPILSGMNQIAGAVLGGVEALIFLWIGCLVFTALASTGPGASVMKQIYASPWLSWLYNHNMLTYFVIGLVRGVL